MERSGERGISGKECHVGHFHDLMIDRRNGRGIAAVNDVHEPITVVLDEPRISVRERPLRGEKTNCHGQLCEGYR